MNPAYTLIMISSVVCGFLISRVTQRSVAIDRFERVGILIGAFCGAMIGAKLPFVLSDWPGLLSGQAWFSDGKTIMFGMVGGYAGVELMKWALDVRVKTGDSFAVPVAVAVGIGRLGCFTGGCCYGTVSSLPWSVDFGDGLSRHPTQIYEFIFHLSSAVVLFWLTVKIRNSSEKNSEMKLDELPAKGLNGMNWALLRGQLFKLYMITYFFYRFVTEFIRPEPKLWFDLTGYQWAAIAFIPLFIGLWIHDIRRRPQAGLAD